MKYGYYLTYDKVKVTLSHEVYYTKDTDNIDYWIRIGRRSVRDIQSYLRCFDEILLAEANTLKEIHNKYNLLRL